jgi:hypothetical protein
VRGNVGAEVVERAFQRVTRSPLGLSHVLM